MATPEARPSQQPNSSSESALSWESPSMSAFASITTLPARLLILSEAPLLGWGIQTCLSGCPGLVVESRSPEGVEMGALLAETAPEVVILATFRPQVNLCRQLQVAQQRGWVRTVICLPATGIGCLHLPGHHGLPLLEATPQGVRRLVQLAVGRREDAPVTAPATLTAREKEIGRLVVAGMSSHEIAELLFISPRTVEKHRANLMEKLGVGNAAALTMELVYLLWEEMARGFAWPTAEPELALPVREAGQRVA